jgi:photosystem II stability/assembly factor-like uncharacterized protein
VRFQIPQRKRFVAVSTALVLVLALIGAPLSAGAAAPTVAGIDVTVRYTHEPPIPSQDTNPDTQVYTVFNGVDMLDANNGWAVGYLQNDTFGAPKRQFVARTVDGGSTITTAEVSPSLVLNGVSARDATHVWAVGTGAQILKWNGTTWAAQAAPVGTGDLNAVSFASASTGFAVGANGRIITTVDGGTWTTASGSPNTTGLTLTGVKAISATNAWAVGKGGIAYQLVGGTWQAKSVSAGTTDLYAVDFFDALHGVAVGANSTVVETRDGGAHWTKRTAPAPAAIGDASLIMLHGVHMSGTGAIVAGGTYGTLLRSVDGGGTWDVGQVNVGSISNDYDWSVNGVAAAPADQTKLMLGGCGPTGSQQVNGYIVSGTQPAIVDVKPAQPTGLAAVADVPAPRVVLTWTPNAQNETGYILKRTDNGGPIVTVNDTLPAGSSTWTDTAVAFDHTYVYTVVAHNAVGDSDPATASIKLTAATPMPVWRFRNLRNGFYLWSADPYEKQTIINTLSGTWFYEGPAYNINTANPANSWALWRFRNNRGGFYLYTADPAEKQTIINTLGGTWTYEGPAYNVSMNSSGAPVWRFRNLHDGTYLYSADPYEKNTIVATLGSTWRLEGPAYYLAP